MTSLVCLVTVKRLIKVTNFSLKILLPGIVKTKFGLDSSAYFSVRYSNYVWTVLKTLFVQNIVDIVFVFNGQNQNSIDLDNMQVLT